MFRLVTLASFTVFTAVTTIALADKAIKMHEGVVVSTANDMLVMSDPDGKNQHAHRVDGATAVTIDGKPAMLLDLVKGDKVKVSVGQDGKVTSIAAMRSKQKKSALLDY
jgi:hypothetical protein